MLRGHVQAYSLTALLEALEQGRHTGSVHLMAEDASRRVRLRQGSIVLTHAGLERADRELEPALVDRLDREQLHEVQRRRGKGEPLGAILLETGWVDQEVLQQTLERAAAEEVYDLALLEEAYFEVEDAGAFEREPETDATALEITLPPSRILPELARREEEWRRLRRTFPSRSAILSPVPEKQERLLHMAREFPWGGELARLDGTYSLRELLDGAPHGRLELARGCHDLLEEGALRLLGLEEAHEAFERWIRRDRLDVAVRILEYLGAYHPSSPYRESMEEEIWSHPTFRDRRSQVVLRGRLESQPLVSLLARMLQDEVAGTVRVTTPGLERLIYLSPAGVAVVTQGSRRATLLGEHLAGAGLLRPSQVDRALTLQKRSGMRLGQVLVTEGILSQERLDEAMWRIVPEMIFESFLWPTGTFCLQTNVVAEALRGDDPPPFKLRFPRRQDSMRLRRSLNRFRGSLDRLHSLHAIYIQVPAIVGGAETTRAEADLLRKIDGNRSLMTLLEAPGQNRTRTCTLVEGLLRRRLIRPLRREEVMVRLASAMEERQYIRAIDLAQCGAALPDEDRGPFEKSVRVLRAMDRNILEETRPVSVEASSADLPLTSLLQVLHRRQRSGQVLLSGPQGKMTFQMEEGEIVVARGQERVQAALPALLRRSGDLSEDQIETARRIQRVQRGTPLTRVLLDKRYVTAQQLDDVYRHHLVEELLEVLAWEGARFTFLRNYEAPEFRDPQVQHFRLGVETFLMEAASRLGQIEALRARFPSGDQVFIPTSAEIDPIRQGADAASDVARAVDGQTPIYEIHRRTGLSRLQVLETLGILWDYDLIQPLPVREAAELAERHLAVGASERATLLFRHLLASHELDNPTLTRLLDGYPEVLRSALTTADLRPGTDALLSPFQRWNRFLAAYGLSPRSGTADLGGGRLLYVSPVEVIYRAGPDLDRAGATRTFLDLLVEQDRVPSLEMRRVRKSQGESPEAVGQALVHRGYITDQELTEARTEFLADTLTEVAFQDDLEFSFQETTLPDELARPHPLVSTLLGETAALLDEVKDRTDRMADVRRHFIRDDALIFVHGDASTRVWPMDPRRPVSMVDGRRSVTQILRIAALSPIEARLGLAELIRNGVIRALTAEEALDAAERARAAQQEDRERRFRMHLAALEPAEAAVEKQEG